MKQRGLFSNLRHLHVQNHSEAGVEKWFSLSELPASLTSLSLIHVIINVERAFDGNTTPNLENLAGLTRLSIQSVAYSTIHGFSVTRWMGCLLAAPNHLVELTYTPCEADDSRNDIDLLAASLPSTLESLTIYPVLLRALTPIYWPPNLTSLTVLPIAQYSPTTSASRPKVPLQIPVTVTRLALIETLNVVCEVSPDRLPHVNKNLCLADPSQLRHLTIDWKSTASAGIMEAISSLICLEYLNLNRTLMHLNVDFRLMPRSLKTIKMAYGVHPTHWQHLPPHARYEDLLNSGDMSFKIVPSMDESYLQHLPRQLTHVEVHGGPLPCNLPVLEHVSFFFLEQTATKDLCNTYMANLPRTLRSISASSSVEKDGSTFWLHDGLNNSALLFESRFPLLTNMTVSSQCVLSPGVLDAWLKHLPRTMTHLTLRLGVKQSTGDLVDTLDLSHVNLPPYLQGFNLSAYKTHLTMPSRIPASLRTIYLAILSLQNGPLLYQSIRGQILADDFLCLVNRRFVDLENLEYI
jgi:hypothetical protein